jgi:hypothetical protein
VRLPVAANILQVHSGSHPAPTKTIRRITRFVTPFEHLDPLPAEFEHLWHEWKLFEPPIPVKGRQYFFFAAHLDPIAGAQSGAVHHE